MMKNFAVHCKVSQFILIQTNISKKQENNHKAAKVNIG